MAAVLTDRRARLQTSPLRHLDVALVLAPILISGLGLLMIYSATHTRLEQAGEDPLYFVKRQAIAIVLGIVGHGDHDRHRLPATPRARAVRVRGDGAAARRRARRRVCR